MDSNKNKLVGLVGYPGVGKDALANYLVSHYGWTRVAFGDAVKRALLEIDPSYERDLEKLESTKRDAGSVTRMKLQGLGAYCRRIDPEHWLGEATDALHDAMLKGSVVVTDVRYNNEAMYLQTAGGTLVGINRDGYGPVNQHESERFTGKLLDKCPVTLNNNDTIESLAVRLLTCV